jgi:hypothetical protein
MNDSKIENLETATAPNLSSDYLGLVLKDRYLIERVSGRAAGVTGTGASPTITGIGDG